MCALDYLAPSRLQLSRDLRPGLVLAEGNLVSTKTQNVST